MDRVTRPEEITAAPFRDSEPWLWLIQKIDGRRWQVVRSVELHGVYKSQEEAFNAIMATIKERGYDKS